MSESLKELFKSSPKSYIILKEYVENFRTNYITNRLNSGEDILNKEYMIIVSLINDVDHVFESAMDEDKNINSFE